jgi:acetyl-CoA carboxylase biotin carboxyl carrier protein
MPTPVTASMAGKVFLISVNAGDSVQVGDEVIVLESMKMEISIATPVDGVIHQILVQPDDVVQEGDVVALVTER